MTFTIGRTLGPYEVVAKLGEGGMGQVYRARDTRLSRDVALKVLPDSFASEPDRLARFTREAQTLASLNHPNIAHLHGLEESAGVQALVMELVEGEDLSRRIARGAMPLDEALPIAKQIAEALEAAHEQGIIHRDLKPANIKVRADGTVKVLDFGLAKAIGQSPATSAVTGPLSQVPGLSMSPTMVSPAMSGIGAILGTAAYMSPEQASGKAVDRRSDIWAFGVVLMEMLTGQAVHTGETVSHVIASVLKSEPDWASLPAGTPRVLERLLRRCLEKDRKRRLDSAADARLEIEEAMTAPHAVPAASAASPVRRWTLALPWALFALASVAAVVAVARRATPNASVPPAVSRALIDFPQFALSGARLGNLFALSPDGALLVFVGNPDGKNRLYLRRLDQFEATPIPGTEDGSQPFFSPDGSSLGFFAAGKLKKVSLAGGSPVTIADAPNPVGGSWAEDDTIVFAPDYKGLMKTSAGGAPATQVTSRSSGLQHSTPLILPGGKMALFTNVATSLSSSIEAVSLETGKVTRVVGVGCCAIYAASGHLIYAHPQSGTMFAVRFDPARLQVVGEPARVMDGVMAGVLTGGQFAASRSGSLMYLTNSTVNERAFVWVDRAGRTTAVDFEKRNYGLPTLSPDGRRLVTGVYDGMNPKEIWVGDLESGTMSRLTGDGPLNAGPIWTPDGTRVTFTSRRESAVQNIYWARADGSGSVERLTTSDFTQVLNDWSPDGRTLLFYENHPATGNDLWTMTLDSERAVKPLLATPYNELAGRFSPDGRYVAYISDRSGRLEVYVQPFPGPGDVRQISSEGGTEVIWARSGRELFFRQGEKMMAVDVVTGPAFSASRPRPLFEGRYEVSFLVPGARYYDVAPDGQRFLMVKSDAPAAPRQLHLVVNWFTELQRVVAPGK